MSSDARERLAAWLRQDVEIVGNTGYPALPRRAELVRSVLSPRRALRLRLSATRALEPAMRRRARAAARSASPLRLHLGSGRFPLDGWVNVDLVGAPVELAWDLRRPLPFADASVDVVFHEHVLEHFDPQEGLALLTECARVLRSGGVLRVGVPDAGSYARGYAGIGPFLDRIRPGPPTRLLALQEVFYWSGHRTAFDAETLVYFFDASGFAGATEMPYGESRVSPAPDHAHRGPGDRVCRSRQALTPRRLRARP